MLNLSIRLDKSFWFQIDSKLTLKFSLFNNVKNVSNKKNPVNFHYLQRCLLDFDLFLSMLYFYKRLMQLIFLIRGKIVPVIYIN